MISPPVTAFAVRPAVPAIWRADVGFALLAILWAGEATVRLPAGPAITAAVYGYFVLRFASDRGFPRAVLMAWPVLAFPMLCLASALWSPVPEVTLVGAIQLVFTVLLAIFLGQRFGLAGLAGLLLTALGLSVAASLVNLAALFPPVWSWEGGFLGIYTNKNALGQRCVMLALTVSLFALADRRRRALWLLALGGTLGVLWLTLSVTSIVLGAAAVGAFWLWMHGAGSAQGRTRLAVLGIAGGLAGLVPVALMGVDPLAELFGAFGKDATLTGRTVLWQVALERAADHPLRGLGYLAYWAAPEYAQETRLLTAAYGSGVSAFHNAGLEVFVALGPLGPVTLAGLLGWSGLHLVRAPAGPVRAWALILFAVLILAALLGSSLYRPHEITLLTVVALGAGAARARP
mgnify:CR=1 FL=1